MPEAPSTTTLGRLLREARKAAGLNQGPLGELVIGGGSSGQSVSDYERGVYVPEADRMARFITVLAMDPDRAWRAWGEQQVKDGPTAASYAAYVSARGSGSALHREAREKIAGDLAMEAGEDAQRAVRGTGKARRSSSRGRG